eukprot:GHVS01012396.1.p1 GENE.GHVS01012396.1~~GHVS01012396.1.p1  ORF type:complete len:572 (+),score=62.25 GHVS01012396.1:128-1717(+)
MSVVIISPSYYCHWVFVVVVYVCCMYTCRCQPGSFTARPTCVNLGSVCTLDGRRCCPVVTPGDTVCHNRRCCIPQGGHCHGDAECCSGDCNTTLQKCRRKIDTLAPAECAIGGDLCITDSQCCANSHCVASTCCGDAGVRCALDSDCCGGICGNDNNRCCVREGNRCKRDFECCGRDRHCSISVEGSVCRLNILSALGSGVTREVQASGALASNNNDNSCVSSGSFCFADAQCCDGGRCHNLVCCGRAGSKCRTDGGCCEGRCGVNGQCCLPERYKCRNDSDCCSRHCKLSARGGGGLCAAARSTGVNNRNAATALSSTPDNTDLASSIPFGLSSIINAIINAGGGGGSSSLYQTPVYPPYYSEPQNTSPAGYYQRRNVCGPDGGGGGGGGCCLRTLSQCRRQWQCCSQECLSGRCCRREGRKCRRDEHCCSGKCNMFWQVCDKKPTPTPTVNCVPDKKRCRSSLECCDTSRCSRRGVCCRQRGKVCFSGADCCSGQCNGICCKSRGSQCRENKDCCANICGLDRRCSK